MVHAFINAIKCLPWYGVSYPDLRAMSNSPGMRGGEVDFLNNCWNCSLGGGMLLVPDVLIDLEVEKKPKTKIKKKKKQTNSKQSERFLAQNLSQSISRQAVGCPQEGTYVSQCCRSCQGGAAWAGTEWNCLAQLLPCSCHHSPGSQPTQGSQPCTHSHLRLRENSRRCCKKQTTKKPTTAANQ